MLLACTDLSPGIIHEYCKPYWPDLTDRLRSVPPWEWPDRITPWLIQLAGPLGNGEPTGAEDLSKLTGALVLVNALGRLHRDMTGAVDDAFRTVRDRLLKSIRLCLSPQEVFSLLDTIDYEARSLEQAFLVNEV